MEERTRSGTRMVWCLLAALAVSAGCDEDDSGSGSFDRAYGDLVCGMLVECCKDTETPVKAADCRALIQQGAAERQSAHFDQAAADACLEATQAASKTCTQAPIPACDRVYTGSKPPGSPCESDLDCEAPEGAEAECSFRGADPDGICQVTRRGKAGDACHMTCTEEDLGGGGSSQSCQGGGRFDERPDDQTACFTNDGVFCSSVGQCAALGAAGDSCADGGRCAEGLYCAYPVEESDPSCAPFLAPGAECASASFEACGEGWCGEDDGVCHAPIAEGEACDPEAFGSRCGPRAVCNRDGVCEADMAGFGGDGAVAFACGLFSVAAGGPPPPGG